MSHPSGIAGEIYPLGEVVNTTDTGDELLILCLSELCSLIYEEDVTLSTLKVIKVFLIGTVPEDDLRAILEVQPLLGVIVSVGANGEHLLKGNDVVCLKLRI